MRLSCAISNGFGEPVDNVTAIGLLIVFCIWTVALLAVMLDLFIQRPWLDATIAVSFKLGAIGTFIMFAIGS